MPEHSIDELLGQLPVPSTPNAEFEARLRSRLTAEWHARPSTAGGASPYPSEFSDTEVIELQTLTETPTEPPKPRRHLLQAAAVVAVIAGAVAVLVAVQRDDENPATNPTPQTTPTPTVATTEPPPPTTAAPTRVREKGRGA